MSVICNSPKQSTWGMLYDVADTFVFSIHLFCKMDLSSPCFYLQLLKYWLENHEGIFLLIALPLRYEHSEPEVQAFKIKSDNIFLSTNNFQITHAYIKNFQILSAKYYCLQSHYCLCKYLNNCFSPFHLAFPDVSFHIFLKFKIMWGKS